MSRLIRSVFPSQNTYIEFRFQNSLRKYEQKPTKKIKCNQICHQCTIHHSKKICNHHHNLSPVPSNNLSNRVGTKGKENTFERGSVGGKMEEERHLISSNKTMRLSKPRELQDISANANELEMKIYASLINISKGESKEGKSGEKSEDEVFLNDFQVDGMEEERQEQGDGRFGRIELAEKDGQRSVEVELCNEIQKQQEQNADKEVCFEEQQLQKPMYSGQKKEEWQMEEEQDEKCISVGLSKLSVEQIQEEQNIPEPLQKQKEQSISIPSPVQQQLFLEQNSHSLHNSQSQKSAIRDHPCPQPQISSKIIEEDDLSEQMMEKCLAFQGGRIYIDSQGQNFYISVRVFNKLRRQCQSIDNLLDILIHQRPYLQSSRSQLRQQLQNYVQRQQ